MVCLLHLFATRARHSQGRMEQPLLKKMEKQPNFWDSRTPQWHGYVNCFKEISLEEIDTLLQEYENRNRKTFSVMLRKY